MGESVNIADFLAKLDAAIDQVMQTEVADGAKEALQEAVERNVYGAYAPTFLSRRKAAGGLADTGNMTVQYGGKVLTITDDAPWQQLWGGKVPGERLAEAIAAGSSRYNFHKAGPRPFHEEAERSYASGRLGADLISGLRARGF